MPIMMKRKDGTITPFRNAEVSVCLLLYSEEDSGAVRKGAEQYSA